MEQSTYILYVVIRKKILCSNSFYAYVYMLHLYLVRQIEVTN